MNITYAIEKQSRVVTHVITVLLVGFAVACRYLTPPTFSVAFVFLLPISFATWFGSSLAGMLITVASATFLVFFDLQFMPRGAAAYWNGMMNAAFGAVFVYIFTELRSLYREQQSLSRRDSLTGVLNRRSFVGMRLKRQ